jgi:hypothetical protein
MISIFAREKILEALRYCLRIDVRIQIFVIIEIIF